MDLIYTVVLKKTTTQECLIYGKGYAREYKYMIMFMVMGARKLPQNEANVKATLGLQHRKSVGREYNDFSGVEAAAAHFG